jgi:hypothetical protein
MTQILGSVCSLPCRLLYAACEDDVIGIDALSTGSADRVGDLASAVSPVYDNVRQDVEDRVREFLALRIAISHQCRQIGFRQSVDVKSVSVLFSAIK